MQSLLLKNLAASMVAGSMFTAGAASTMPSTPPAPLEASTTANSYTIVFSSPILSPELIELPQIPPPEDALDTWIERLIDRESRGVESVRILDSNGKYSYGCLQFQLETFRIYGTKFDLVSSSASDKELVGLIYDCTLQKRITRQMILSDRQNWRHWYTSVTKTRLGYPPKVHIEIAENIKK